MGRENSLAEKPGSPPDKKRRRNGNSSTEPSPRSFQEKPNNTQGCEQNQPRKAGGSETTKYEYTVEELCGKNKELLYELMDNVWKEVNIAEAKQKEILENHGVLSNDEKTKMLQNWIKKKGSLEEAQKILEKKIGNVFRQEAKLDHEKEPDLCKDIVQRIPDDHWLKFARLGLQLPEKEIKEFRGQCEFTEEQKYQLILTYGKNVIVSRNHTRKQN